MRPLCRSLVVVAFALVMIPPALFAQGVWEAPEDPCKLKAGHHLVNGGMMHLKIAVESDDENRTEDRLRRAQEVLVRAIEQNNQADNPAAWYWLGRYYVYRNDAYGADSAFRRAVVLAPECEAEARRYVEQLQPVVRREALLAWQEGAIDSAVGLFHLAASLMPDDAEIPFFLTRMYADRQQFDSAAKYVEIGIERAGGDEAHADRQLQAMLAILRGREGVAFEDPATANIVESRMRRDTLLVAVERDSTQLAKLIGEWAGQRLRPDVQQAVSRDSATLADRIAAARGALLDAKAKLQQDSTAAGAAFAPAFAAYERYLEMYPDDVDVTLRLLRRYSLLGNTRGIESTTARIARLPEVDPNELAQVGAAVHNDGYPAYAVELLEIAVNKNPYIQAAQYVLARASYALRDGPRLARAAKQLLAIDPLNPQSVRMMAASWDLAGNQDSVQTYVALANEGLQWGVTVTQFLPTGSAAVVSGSVANITSQSLAPTTLLFEFLDASGGVVASGSAEIPALEPRRRHAFSVRAEVSGAAAWRYRRQ
ncbi:MAG: FxLYD domain-containing protein [Gemmatimonadota bacterium]|nr:FxLYD domain-containing protein [Gemmatimonadota bacterium]MDH3477119.1 FxLYD domain-containing protein [Gemmatimonadota bacterium]MDH5550208.1 FxLYD domain-containing protein [Gemmatimonadota bacterium]